MPVTLKRNMAKFKDDNNQYIGIDAIAEKTTAEEVALIEQKGAETRASIPDDYTALSDAVTALSGDVSDLEAGKVDKVTGKGLSENDYTSAEKAQVALIDSISDAVDDLETAMDGKVDKVSGKGLSENDYTTADQTQVEKIPEIEENVAALNTAIATKADQTQVDEIAAALDEKAAIINDTATGAIATFADGADDLPMALTVGIEPMQDLHGYDNPWPGGGGKNLLNNTATSTTHNGVTFTVNNDGTVSTSGTASGTAVLRIYQTFDISSDLIISGCPAGGGASTGYSVIAANNGGVTVGQIDVGNGGNISATSISSIAQVQLIVRDGTNVDGKVFKPMIRLASDSDATYAPYSNICPITGWTGAEVTRTGKNLLNALEGFKYCRDNDWDSSVVSIDETNKTVVFDALGGLYRGIVLNANSEQSDTQRPAIPLKENTQYTFIFRATSTSTTLNIAIAYTDGTNTGSFKTNQQNADGFIVFTTPSNKTIKSIYIGKYGGVSTFYYEDFGLFEGVVTYADFVRYAGQNYTITWETEAGTVYGGTLSINKDGTGSLVVDMANVDLGTLTWAKSSSGLKYVGTLPSVSYKYSDKTKFLCTNYKFDGVGNSVRGYYGADKTCRYWYTTGTSSAREVYIHDESYSDAATFKTAMSGVMLVYELATPVTYTLTAPQIKTLLGMNNIWADTGDTTADYPADTKLYIDGKFAELQALILENISNS